MAETKTVIHVTHETIGKVGGIGAVLEGFFTCRSYLDAVSRSIVLGPTFHFDGPLQKRLGEDVEVLYCSSENIEKSQYSFELRWIESLYNVPIIYGRRTYHDPQTAIKSSPELLLFDIRNMKKGPINLFKRELYEHFGVRSDLHEHLWEYEQYIRTAPVAIEALKAIGAAGNDTTIIAHEFMGMPTALAAILEEQCNFKTIFYAHETATIRNLIEKHPGHDTMLSNLIRYCRKNNLHLKDVFGDQSSYFKHPLVEAARFCDRIFAVGNRVAEELRFLEENFESAEINLVYNGVPAYQTNLSQKLNSKRKLQQYCQNLLGYEADFIFTHITRLVTSKGLWRDFQVLEHIERALRAQNKTAVMLLLSTEVAHRPSEDILRMESEYNWPVAHREGWPDLSGGEAELYTKIQAFNARSRNIKIVFINQFGFNRLSCGRNIPEDIQLIDICRGSDVEFGMSIYEPFGISQLESLTFGGICVISSVCGCAGFVKDIAVPENINNIIIADYTNLNGHNFNNLEKLLKINGQVRGQIEQRVSEQVANLILSRLTEDTVELEERIETGFSLARNMSWETVVRNYLLPGLENRCPEKDTIFTKSG